MRAASRGDEVVLYAEFTSHPETTDQLCRLISWLQVQVRQEPGNLEFSIFQLEGSPSRFFVFERYRDQAAFQEHLAADYGTRFNAALEDLSVEKQSRLTFLRELLEADPCEPS